MREEGLSTATTEGARALEQLGTRLRALTADSDAAPRERAERLASFEQDLIAYTSQQAREDPQFGSDGALPALALASDWRTQIAEQGLREEVRGADALIEDLVADDAERWHRGAEAAAQSGSAAACFEALLDASVLDRESVIRRRRLDAEPPLRERRASVRDAFLQALAAEQLDTKQQAQWATHLSDAADVVLTSIEDVDAPRAAAQLSVMEDDVAWHLRHVPVPPTQRRRLKRKLRRLRYEGQERELQGRVEARFGKRFVFHVDRLIVWLIFFVLAALFVEMIFDLSVKVRIVLMIADALACGVFLTEFFVKLSMVRGRGRWLARHFVIDFLPSIPFGVLMLATGMISAADLRGDKSRLARGFRLVRILRLTRMARAFTFLARGFDRLARRYGHLLNHNIVLYPNREERRLAVRHQESLAARAWRLRSSLNDEWRNLLQTSVDGARADVAGARIAALEAARAQGLTLRTPRTGGSASAGVRDLPAEQILRRLDDVSPAELEADLGEEFVSRSARAVRMFARPGLRWIPILRKYVPRVAPHMSAAEVTAAAAHTISAEISRHHGRWFWVADLYGTVTPSEFVDRVGSTMMRGAFRPAYRLALFGLAFLAVDLLSRAVPSQFLDNLWSFLRPLVGEVIVILGGVCLLILALGWWLKRLAGQATFFYEQTVNAQFLALTEAIKGRQLSRDGAIFDARVFVPEELALQESYPGGAPARQAAFAEAMRGWLVRARAGKELAGVNDAMERALLLYRDSLDGALFAESDNRTTNQLIGSPALRQMRSLSHRVDKREKKALATLDLGRARSSIRGPYLWFSFIAKAIAQSTARLIVEYNRYAIPLDEIPFAADEERLRYEAWVATGKPPAGEEAREKLRRQGRGYITTAFTALHFLDDDAGRDQDVAARFGPEVLANLRRDRRILFREAFGTYPLHTRSKDQRVLNLYRLYERWFAGGRAFLIPLRLLWRWVAMFGRFFKWLVRAVGEIRTPRMRGDARVAADADFPTAVRKIGRMRDPVVWASLWLRARFDPEYIGVRLPGTQASGLEGATWESDLRFLHATGSQRRLVEEEQARAEADLRRLARLVDEGLLEEVAGVIGVPLAALGREHLRAATVAYRGDYQRVRSLLSCERVLDETAAGVFDHAPLPRSFWPRPRLKAAFRRWWREHGRGDKVARKWMWRQIVYDTDGARSALDAWRRWGPAEARRLGLARLADLLRHPGRISEQIVTLRIVQTLALIDLLNYREHVYRLGGYEASGDDVGDWLRFGQETERPPSTGSVKPVT